MQHESGLEWGANGEIYLSRGIRKGDPLSPYLFVLYIERLAHYVKLAMENNFWRPTKLGKNGTPISHLFFVDDLVLFAKATLDQVKVIQYCMENWCLCLREKVNTIK